MTRHEYKFLNEDDTKKASFAACEELTEPFHVWTTDGDGDLNQMIQLTRKEARELALFIINQITED